MGRSCRYVVVDVFTETRFEGNPLAVFLDPGGLSDDEMQALARELNLSETSFVFPGDAPNAVARLRIFTPGKEVPFAGHPTIGTAYALVESGRVAPDCDRFVLQEKIGDVAVRLERRRPFEAWLRTPPIRFEARCDRDAVARALGVDPRQLLADKPVQVVSAGNPFLYVPLQTPDAVDRATLDGRALERVAPADTDGVFVFAPTPSGVYARMLPVASTGIAEDPATGSATGPLGAYLAEYGLLERRDGVRFVNEQGVKIKRRSLVHGILRYRDGALETVEVGGSAVGVIEGTVTI